MFIEKGFSDFLAKPIDVSKLDEIIEKWLPKEKRIKSDGSPASAADNQGGPAALEIPGLDVKRGIAMTGGSLEGYRQVLSTFRKDADARLALLRKLPSESGLVAFVTQVHALKSVLASIGADDISSEAARLEAAGNAGEAPFIRDALPGFASRLTELAEAIQVALATGPDAGAQKSAEPAPSAAGYPLWCKLAGALKAERRRDIDKLLEKLKQKCLDAKTKESLDRIADHVLMAEFDEALKIIGAARDGAEGLEQ
jgi:HPt (histidine-containing phosphotransfer) domain-containing protein